jgi:histidinol-phosphate aminotransferase
MGRAATGPAVDPSPPAAFDPALFVDPAVLRLPAVVKTDYRGVLNLSSNENNHGLFRGLFGDFLESCPLDLATRYPDWPSLVQLAARLYALDAEQIVMTAGADQAIHMVLAMLGRRCRHLILQEPNYPNYRYYAELAGLDIDGVAPPPGRWGQTVVATMRERLVARAPAVVVITTPNGHTGQPIAEAEVAHLADLCARDHHLLVIDETYGPFADLPAWRAARHYRGTVVIKSFSKCCGMAGLRLGMVVADAALASCLRRWNSVNSINALAAAFLDHCVNRRTEVERHEQWRQGAQQDMIDGVRSLFPRWHAVPSATNFILLDTGCTGTAAALARHLATWRIVVKLLNGLPGLDGCVRMTLPEPGKMRLVLEAIGRFGEIAPTGGGPSP